MTPESNPVSKFSPAASELLSNYFPTIYLRQDLEYFPNCYQLRQQDPNLLLQALVSFGVSQEPHAELGVFFR